MSRVRFIDGPAKGIDADLPCGLGDNIIYPIPDTTGYFDSLYEQYIVVSFIGRILLAKLVNKAVFNGD